MDVRARILNYTIFGVAKFHYRALPLTGTPRGFGQGVPVRGSVPVSWSALYIQKNNSESR